MNTCKPEMKMTTIMIMTMVTMTLISMLPNIMIYFDDQDEDQSYDGSDGHGESC
jgi:ABC-type cobalt transport system substrate-binding protein